MELINNTKSKIITSKGAFPIGKTMDFSADEARRLCKYPGIETTESLKVKTDFTPSEYDLLKAEATELGIDFPGNASKAALKKLIEEAKGAQEDKDED
jgi:hypothetical protein